MTDSCPRCGEPVEDPDAFCGECGADLGSDPGPASPTERTDAGGQTARDGSDQTAGPVRRSAAETCGQALDWLSELPVLVGTFAVVALAGSLDTAVADVLASTDVAESTSTVVTAGFTLVEIALFLIAGGVAHVYADRLTAGERVRGGIDELRSTAVDVSGKLISLFGVFVVYSVAVAIGALLVLPGLYLALRLALAFPACVLDDQGIRESISTSWDTARGNLLKLAGIVALVFVGLLAALLVSVTLLAAVALAIPVGALVLAVGQLVVAALVGVVVGTLQLSLGRVYVENRDAEPGASSTGD